MCQFLLEDVTCCHSCIGRIIANEDELDAREAQEFLSKIGIKFYLTTTYNLEGNSKSEGEHSSIVKALVTA